MLLSLNQWKVVISGKSVHYFYESESFCKFDFKKRNIFLFSIMAPLAFLLSLSQTAFYSGSVARGLSCVVVVKVIWVGFFIWCMENVDTYVNIEFSVLIVIEKNYAYSVEMVSRWKDYEVSV